MGAIIRSLAGDSDEKIKKCHVSLSEPPIVFNTHWTLFIDILITT